MRMAKSRVISAYGLASLAIGVLLGLAAAHVYETKGYLQTGLLRNLLLWALATNIICAALILFRSLRSEWVRNHATIFALDVFVSVLPFVLIRCLRIPSPDRRVQLVGFVYAVFVFGKTLLLAWYLLSTKNIAGGGYRLGKWIFTVSLVLYSAISPWAAIAAWPTADEPAYLLLTHSLVADRDFDLANNYREHDYRLFYPAEPQTSDHHTLRNERGQEFPVHDIGISVLLVPGYRLAGRLGAMLEMNVFSAFLALGIYLLALNLGATQHAASTCWFLFAFTSPLVVYSSQIYPEAVGGACALLAVIAFDHFRRTSGQIFILVASSLLALLPWLSVRYWMILAPMLFVFTLYILAQWPSGARTAWYPVAAMVLPIAISLGAFCWFDMRHYGAPIPNAGYVLLVRAWQKHHLTLFVSNPADGLLGLFFDRAFGLLATAPIYILSITALLMTRKISWTISAILVPSIAYIVFSGFNRYWYGGWAPPSRYIFVSLALLAPLASLVLSRRRFSALVWVLGAWSFLVSIAFTAFPLTRYSYWDARSMSLARFIQKTLGFDFGVMFPSFIRPQMSDYALAAVWMGVVAGCIWLLNKAGVVATTVDDISATGAGRKRAKE
jgi:hypothetical protein